MKRSLPLIGFAIVTAVAAGPLTPVAPAAATARPHASEPTLVQGPFFGTPGPNSFVVPAGVTQIVAELGGAFGGNSGSNGSTHVGGPGEVVQAQLAVSPGQTVKLFVAGRGNAGCASSCSADPSLGAGGIGYGKGGNGNNDGVTVGGGGGGSSELSLDGTNPAVVAAGGGGAGASGDGQLANSSYAAPGADGTDGDSADGAVLSGSGGGGGGKPGGQGGALGGGGYAGTSFGGTVKGSSTVGDGYVQIAYYEPGLDAQDDAYSVRENTTLAVPAPGVLANDRSFGLPPRLARPALHGAVSLATDGSFTYKPMVGFVGYDTFTYALQDSDREALATVTILVGHVAAGALTSIGVPGNGRVLLGLACGLSGRCPFDIAIIKKVGGVNRRIAHGTTTYLPRRSGVFSFRLPLHTRVSYGTGRNHVVHATLYITLHRAGHRLLVIANRPITIK